MLQKAIFNINESPFFKGYTANQYWNGWATPYFEKSEANKLAGYITEASSGYSKMTYDAQTDRFTLSDDNSNEPESWKGEDLETENGIKHLYAIGAFSWIWDNAKDMFTPEEMVQYYLANFTNLWGKELETAYEDITEREFALTGVPKHYDIPEYVETYLAR